MLAQELTDYLRHETLAMSPTARASFARAIFAIFLHGTCPIYRGAMQAYKNAFVPEAGTGQSPRGPPDIATAQP